MAEKPDNKYVRKKLADFPSPELGQQWILQKATTGEETKGPAIAFVTSAVREHQRKAHGTAKSLLSPKTGKYKERRKQKMSRWQQPLRQYLIENIRNDPKRSIRKLAIQWHHETPKQDRPKRTTAVRYAYDLRLKRGRTSQAP